MKQKRNDTLKNHRHLIACMIDHSFGYFTPKAALYAIKAYKKDEPYYCEWYMDMAGKRLYNLDKKRFESREEEDNMMKEINKDTICRSLRYRKFKKAHAGCLAIVDRNIEGNESIGASWF